MTPHPECLVWNENSKDKIKIILNSNEVKNKLEHLLSPWNFCDINTTLNEFTDILNTSCKRVLPTKARGKTKIKVNPRQKQKWYNQDCHTLKKNLRNMGNLLTKYPNKPT